MSAPSSKKRLLIGPFLQAGLSDYMLGAFDDFDTITFGVWSEADIQVSGLPSLQEILDLLPPNWSPDYLILWRPEYGYIPLGLEHAKFPSAMLVSDWYLAFSDSIEAAWRVDMVVTGTLGERIFRTAGFDNVMAMPMLGYQPEIDGKFTQPTGNRDIDVYVGGNANWIIHRQREQIVAELLGLPAAVRLVHGPYVSRERYNNLLGRSKIVVNQTVIGEINMKVYEVAAAGACLFVEEDNLDILNYLVPGESVVLFNRENLLEKVEYYLGRDSEREGIAMAAKKAMAKFTYRENFSNIIKGLVELNSAGNLMMKRPCFELSDEVRAAGMLGYSLNHNGGDYLAPVKVRGENPLDSTQGRLLETAAQYFARLACDRGNIAAPEHIWPTPEILKSFRDASEMNPGYLPAAYCWARVAAAHLDSAVALPILERVTRLLLDGCPIPFSSADFFFWDPATRFDFERQAWELLEKGESLDDGLRSLILEDVLVVTGRLVMAEGDLKLAEDIFNSAIKGHLAGVRARPLLAELLGSRNQWLQAAEMWRAHLEIHPLDIVAQERLLLAGRECDAVKISQEEVQRFERCKSVLNDSLS